MIFIKDENRENDAWFATRGMLYSRIYSRMTHTLRLPVRQSFLDLCPSSCVLSSDCWTTLSAHRFPAISAGRSGLFAFPNFLNIPCKNVYSRESSRCDAVLNYRFRSPKLRQRRVRRSQKDCFLCKYIRQNSSSWAFVRMNLLREDCKKRTPPHTDTKK